MPAHISFTKNETEQLKQIVRDWQNEGLVLPPFKTDVKSIFKKLEIPVDTEDPEIYPKTQEQLSAPWSSSSQ